MPKTTIIFDTAFFIKTTLENWNRSLYYTPKTLLNCLISATLQKIIFKNIHSLTSKQSFCSVISERFQFSIVVSIKTVVIKQMVVFIN